MELSPDQFASLKRVLSEPAGKVAAALNLPVAEAQTVIERLEVVVRRCAVALGSARLLVIHKRGQSGGRDWNDALIAGLIRAQTLVVTVGDDGTVVGEETGAISVVTAAKESERGPRMTALCTAGQLCVFGAGKPIAEIGTAPPPLQGRSDWKRSSRELRASLDLHFTHCVDNEKELRYWQKKGDRILLAGPDGTEKLFHHSLFWWCNNLIADAIDVYGEANSMGQDKTDITIVTEAGSIVIEVKWLGKNENGTSWAKIRIHEGMIQVADYLQRNKRLVQGYLVVYDARSEKQHRDESDYPANSRHDRCEEPIIYFLRSETPSQLATRLAGKP